MELMMIDTTNVIFLLVVGLYVVLLGMILAYVYFDAQQRGLNGWLIAGMTFFTGTIAGALAWLLLRPKLKPQPIPVKR
jgi:uncharacterized membrane protein